jgi:hypothetical protein
MPALVRSVEQAASAVTFGTARKDGEFQSKRPEGSRTKLGSYAQGDLRAETLKRPLRFAVGAWPEVGAAGIDQKPATDCLASDQHSKSHRVTVCQRQFDR